MRTEKPDVSPEVMEASLSEIPEAVPEVPIAVEQPALVKLKLKVCGEELEKEFTCAEIVKTVQRGLAADKRFQEVGQWRREILPFRIIVGSPEFKVFLMDLLNNLSPLVTNENVQTPPPIPPVFGDPNAIVMRDDANDQERERVLRQRMERGDVGAAAILSLMTLRRNPKILDKELKYD